MFIVFLFLCALCFPVDAEVYKCTKADGSIHYQAHECDKAKEKQNKLLSCIDCIAPVQDKITPIVTAKQEKTRRTKLRKEAKTKRKTAAKNKIKKQKIKEKINSVYTEYRHGYTANRRGILAKRLEVYKGQQKQIRSQG